VFITVLTRSGGFLLLYFFDVSVRFSQTAIKADKYSHLPSSCRHRLSSATASCGACSGSVPRPTNRRGCLRTVCARSSFSSRHRSNVSSGFAFSDSDSVYWTRGTRRL